MDAAAIERFSGPPLAERAWISDQARGCVVRPGADDLETLVIRSLRGQASEDLAWDAWRRPDGRWTVIAAVGADSPVSTWLYDPRSRSVHPDDAASHRLASEDVVVPLRTAPVHVDGAARDHADPAQQAHEPHASAPVEASAPTAEPEPEPEPNPPAPSPRSKSRKGRRASVPRWDEILFGAQESDA